MSASFYHEARRVAAATELHRAIGAGDCDGVRRVLQGLPPHESSTIVNAVSNDSGKNALDLALSTTYPTEHFDYMAAMNRMNEAMQRGDYVAATSLMLPKDKKSTMVELLMEGGAEISTSYIVREVVDGGYSSISKVLERATRAMINGITTDGWTALQAAVFHDKGYNVISSLLNAGANPNICGPACDPPLQVAVQKDQGYSVISSLLNQGADPNIVCRPSSDLPLQTAVHKDMGYSTISSLLNSGANPNVVCRASGELPLVTALANDLGYSTISSLLGKGANPNARANNRHQETSLHLAVRYNAGYSTLSSLVEHGANVNLQDANGMTPLHRLLQMTDEDHKDCLDSLVRARGFDPNIADRHGMTALHYLSKHGVYSNDSGENGDNYQHYPPEIRQLMQQMEEQRHESQRRMQEMLRMNRVSLRRLMAAPFGGAGYDQQDSDEEEEQGDGTVLSVLIRKGSNVDATDGKGCTPLYYAAKSGRLEIVVGLLQASANPNGVYRNPNGANIKHPLHAAIVGGHTEIVEALLQAGSTAPPLGNETCLHLVAKDGKGDIMTLLLRHGAYPNDVNAYALTPLHYAVMAGKLSTMEILISSCANVNAVAAGGDGRSPLHCAACVDNLSIWDLLLQSGADVHKKDNMGMTALMCAANANLGVNTLFMILGRDPTQLNLGSLH